MVKHTNCHYRQISGKADLQHEPCSLHFSQSYCFRLLADSGEQQGYSSLYVEGLMNWLRKYSGSESCCSFKIVSEDMLIQLAPITVCVRACQYMCKVLGCVWKLLPAKPCCLCHHGFQGWFSWSPTHGTSRPCGRSCMLGCDCSQTVPRVMPSSACLLCSCAMSCTEKKIYPRNTQESSKTYYFCYWSSPSPSEARCF